MAVININPKRMTKAQLIAELQAIRADQELKRRYAQEQEEAEARHKQRYEAEILPMLNARITKLLDECTSAGWKQDELAVLRQLSRDYGVEVAQTVARLANTVADRQQRISDGLPVAYESLLQSYALLERQLETLLGVATQNQAGAG
jgi:hypothetical protein